MYTIFQIVFMCSCNWCFLLVNVYIRETSNNDGAHHVQYPTKDVQYSSGDWHKVDVVWNSTSAR